MEEKQAGFFLENLWAHGMVCAMSYIIRGHYYFFLVVNMLQDKENRYIFLFKTVYF